MPRHITEYILYRWRYYISCGLAGLLIGSLLIVATIFVPGGLSVAEQASAVISSGLSPLSLDPMSVIDLPYNLLQHLSFMALGVTTLSIKLPSLILGLLSLVGIILLLRHWSHTNVAVIAAVIVTTTSQFIFSSQDGTPGIMYIFMPTWLLLLALKVSRQVNKRSFWEFLLVAAVALSLYTPLSIYIILALASATLLHPHLRYIVGRISRKKLFAAGFIGIGLLSPLILALITKPDIGLTLLGIPRAWPNLETAAVTLLETHFSFLLFDSSKHAQPVYTLPSILLALLGIVHLFRAKHTARSYIITSWMLLLAPIIFINPGKTTITFVPVMLLIAAGIDELLHRWYSLFPRNPYARVAGLFPVTLLVVGMALTGIERYFYTYRYSPPVAADFSTDLTLLQDELTRLETQPTALLPTETEVPFYQAVAKYDDSITVILPTQPLPVEEQFIITRAAFSERDMGKREPTKIITNGKSSQSDRLYLYKMSEK
jgi:hypothetical protein